MDSTSKSCKRHGGRYWVTGLPNGISCTNGQHTERKSYHMFPLKEKDRKWHQAWVRFVQRYRPKWSSTNASFLCTDQFNESGFTKNRELTAKLGMKRKLKQDAVPTIDLSLANWADTLISYWQIERKDSWDLSIFDFTPWSSSNN